VSGRETILVTGFEPFGGETINPSWEAARALDGWRCAEHEVVSRRLPCVFGVANETLADEIVRVRPGLVVMVGQAGGRSEICIERIAQNQDSHEAPDNAGVVRRGAPIVIDGPQVRYASVDVEAIVAAIANAGIPVRVSDDAGNFVCNHVFYGACHLGATKYPAMRVVFVHIPFAPTQAERHPGESTLPIEKAVEALKIAISVAIAEIDAAHGGNVA